MAAPKIQGPTDTPLLGACSRYPRRIILDLSCLKAMAGARPRKKGDVAAPSGPPEEDAHASSGGGGRTLPLARATPPVLSSAPNNYTWGLHARGVPRKSPGRGPGSGGHFQHLLAMGGSNVGPTTEGLGKISAGPGNVVTGAGAQEIAQRQGATLRGNGHDRERKIAQGLTGHKRRKCWDFVNRKRSGAGSGPASEFG